MLPTDQPTSDQVKMWMGDLFISCKLLETKLMELVRQQKLLIIRIKELEAKGDTDGKKD